MSDGSVWNPAERDVHAELTRLERDLATAQIDAAKEINTHGEISRDSLETLQALHDALQGWRGHQDELISKRAARMLDELAACGIGGKR